MDITLFEKVNKTKLKEVLECNNIPFEKNDDKKWQDSFIKTLSFYNKKKYTKKGIETKYEQCFKYGRYNTKYGLQTFQREVRKYISGEFNDDLDFVNCHPVILNQLLKANNSKLCSTDRVKSDGTSLLKEYIENRDTYLEKNKITKLDMIKMINNQECSKEYFKDIHKQIYKELLPVLLKENKVLFNRIKSERKKKKKDYNHEGSFLSHYLQNIENECLKVLYNYLNENGYTVGALMFDGLLVEKVENNPLKLEIEKIEELIKQQTGFDIKIIFKSTETKWVPIKGENELQKLILDKDFGEKFSKQTARSFFDDSKNPKIIEGRYKEFMDYMNRYVCQFDEPNSYGFRMYENTKFKFRSLSTLRDRIGLNVINTWNMSDDLLNFIKPNFIVDETKLDSRYYNQYERPKMENTTYEELKDSILFEYLLEIVCDNNIDLYNWTLDYISVILKKGRTEHCLVLMGGKGIGKSFFMYFLSLLIGEEYSMPINDINKLTNHFNKWMENKILIKIEEVCPNAGEYMKLQNILKTLITETQIEIIPKGLDGYNIESYTNPIISTNFDNPVQGTDENRRFVFYGVSSKRRGDRKFFGSLEKEIKENIEKFRYYFYNRNYKDLVETRPITEKEKDVIDINMSITDRFLKQQFYVTGKEDDKSRSYSRFLNDYNEFCKKNQEKSLIPKYITPILKSHGFTTKTINRKVYIQGNSLVDCKIDSDSEEQEFDELD